MARVVHDAKLAKREQRLRLEARKKPYWLTLNEGEHLGYYRGARVAKWVARYRRPGASGNYQETTLAEADDHADADGMVILNFRQAQETARQWFAGAERNGGRAAGVYTVAAAVDDYMATFQGKDVVNTKSRIETFIRPELGHLDVTRLTTQRINEWLAAVANAPARLRTGRGNEQNLRVTADSEDARRRRRSSANRILTVLKAALNLAYRNGKVAADDAWRRVRPFPNADAARLRYLSDDEARRLVNGCDPAFRPLVQAALLTGARYSELIRLEARDFDRQSQTVWLRETKSGRSRAVYLEAEGLWLFEQVTAGKSACDPILLRADGKKWQASQQSRPLAQACAAGKVDRCSFHDLRRTYGARLALSGAPMSVIAKAMGHADERITQRHYAHLSRSCVADIVRIGMSGMGIVEQSNIVRLDARA
ncbi:MAG: tyrosine-type recombinase/integrase [Sphingomonadaceae bacterium]